MKNVKRPGVVVILLAMTIGLAACGGSKETLSQQPDPFPEPPIVNESPQPVEPTEPKVAATPTPADEPTKEPLILETIYFDFDKSTLTESARAILAANARRLQEYPFSSIRVAGHCDERGTVEYNLALGERRARAVRNYLTNFGVRPDRITIISYGKERPADTRHTPAAWQRNRRAEFLILNQ